MMEEKTRRTGSCKSKTLQTPLSTKWTPNTDETTFPHSPPPLAQDLRRRRHHGIYAAQLANPHLRVIVVASPSNFAYLRTLGVTACIDRHQPSSTILASIASTLREHGGSLRYAMDCVRPLRADLCLVPSKPTPERGVGRLFV